MSMKTGTSTFIIASLLSAGCTGLPGADSDDGADGTVVGDGDGDGDGDGAGGSLFGTGGGTSDGVGGGVGGGDGDGDGDGDGPIATCLAGVAPTSQIPRLLNRQYVAAIRDLLGVEAEAAGALNADHAGVINPYIWAGYQAAAEEVAATALAGTNKSMFMACDPATAGCYEETIRTFGRKAFRRPLTQPEVDRFMGLTTITPAGTTDEISEAILYAFLVSPSFIMLPELAEDVEGEAIKLNSYEVATRLSMILWGSVPDEELNAAADADMLTNKEQILAQALRMIEVREKAGPHLGAAHGSFLGMDEDLSHWWKVRQDTTLYPTFSEAAVPAMKEEMLAFFEEVVFSGSYEDLFLSNVGFVNQDTAAFYGLNPTDYGEELERVMLTPAEQRPGFLTRAGFLSSFSSYKETSPILRGAFISINILGVNPGPPDPTVLDSEPPEGEYFSRREEVIAMTAPPNCARCHAEVVNPPGFAMENYDAVGAWQVTDRLGGAIEPIQDIYLDDSGTKVTVNSPLELMTMISTNLETKRLYAQKLVRFATGRQPNSSDACVVDDAKVQLSADYTALDLFTDLTQADSFRLRTVAAN
jgi:hypothetical protein